MTRNRKYQDSVFTDLFGADRDCKKNFISLYNAISGSDYRLEEVGAIMERKRIEQSVIKTFDNDVSWRIGDRLVVLVEHQSTINQNMPFRCLEYVTRIYETMVESRERYREGLVRLPAPDFYVVYSGQGRLPQKSELRLSDSFSEPLGKKLELTVTVLNCSESRRLPIVRDCDILEQYSRFVEIVKREYDPMHRTASFTRAINESIREGTLADYLGRKAREVRNMLIAEYDYATDIAVKQQEAFEDGVQQKALESAVLLVKKYGATPQAAAEDTNAPLAKLLAALAQERG